MNLSEKENDEMVEKIIGKNLRTIKQAINKEEEKEVNQAWNQLKPYLKHEVFQNKFQENNIQDYILDTLNFLNEKTKEKTQ